jgi:hypothetical protein
LWDSGVRFAAVVLKPRSRRADERGMTGVALALTVNIGTELPFNE